MCQETAIVNAREIFGDLSDINKIRNMKGGFERCWQWPDELGNGFMWVTKFSPGFILGIGDYQLSKKLVVRFGWKTAPFAIGFSLPGKIWSTLAAGRTGKENLLFRPGQSFISYLPRWQGIVEYPPEIPIRTVVIYIAPLLLNTFMEGQHDRMPPVINDIVNGVSEKHYYAELLPALAVNMTLQQIFNCPYQGALKRLYLKSKALELITHSLMQLTVDKGRRNSAPNMHSADVELVREARDILIRNLENPPSLPDLAKRTGVNKNKLNQGFRQVFGASVFEYLRIYRLERARMLLENNGKNVTEAAFEVGYAQQSSFTKAFKKHFGTSPSCHLR